jgi:peptidoglycan-N-acetylglucosamine deacetylase
MNKQVFYDPQRKRWKRLRRIFDVLALLGVLLGLIFVIGLLRIKPLPELLLATPKRNFKALSAPTPADGSEAVGCSFELGRRIAGGILCGL